MAKAPNYDSEILRRVRDRRDPAQTARTQTRMVLAAKIAEKMKEQKLTKSQFANLLKQQPSVITKWLSGTHNFTIDTLVDIGRILEIDFFNMESDNEPIQNSESIQFTMSVKVTNPRYQPTQLYINGPKVVYQKATLDTPLLRLNLA